MMIPLAPPEAPRRLARFRVTYGALAALLRPRGDGILSSDFSPTARIVDVYSDREQFEVFWVVVEDESLAEVHPGDRVPEMRLIKFTFTQTAPQGIGEMA